MKGVTAIILKDTPGEKLLPRMEKREGGQHLGLVGEAVGPLEVNPAQLVELGGLVAEVVVPGQDLQHGGQGGGAHDGGVLAKGFRIFRESRRAESLGRSILS